MKLDVKPKTLEDRLVLFVRFLVDNKLKSSTVKTYISAIRGTLADDGIKLNEDQFLITSLTCACRLQDDRVIHRLLIYKELLNLILQKIDVYFQGLQQLYLAKLYKAMLVVGYYGLLHAGELGTGPHVLLAKDVHIRKNKNKLLFILWSSKTHNKGVKPQMIKISSEPVDLSQKIVKRSTQKMTYCPFSMLRDYIDCHPQAFNIEEQFFVFCDNTAVTTTNLRNTLKNMLKLLNFDTKLYNLHSLRIGRCCDLYKYGLSIETIKKIGHWKSNAIFTYLCH